MDNLIAVAVSFIEVMKATYRRSLITLFILNSKSRGFENEFEKLIIVVLSITAFKSKNNEKEYYENELEL